jgi:hypothetical protein
MKARIDLKLSFRVEINELDTDGNGINGCERE